MFKFVDEESDDYIKSVKDDDVQYAGGTDDPAPEGEMSMGKKIGVGVAFLAVVGLVVFLATKGSGGDGGDAATPDAGGSGDDGDDGGDGGSGEAGGDGGDGGSEETG